VAVTLVAALIVTLQVLVPLQAPLHPAKMKPVVGAAVRVTAAPEGKFAVHVVPQLMPDGALVTVPVPEPAVVTVSWVGEGAGVGAGPELSPWQPIRNNSAKNARAAKTALNCHFFTTKFSLEPTLDGGNGRAGWLFQRRKGAFLKRVM